MSKSYVPLVLIGGTIMIKTNIFETEMSVESIDNMYEILSSLDDIAANSMYAGILEIYSDEIDEFYYELRKSVKTNIIDEDDYTESMFQLKKIIKKYFIERVVEKAVRYHDCEIILAAEKYLNSIGIRSRKVENGCSFDSSIMTVEYVEATADNSKHRTVKEVICPMYYYYNDDKIKIINKMKVIVYKYEA